MSLNMFHHKYTFSLHVLWYQHCFAPLGRRRLTTHAVKHKRKQHTQAHAKKVQNFTLSKPINAETQAELQTETLMLIWAFTSFLTRRQLSDKTTKDKLFSEALQIVKTLVKTPTTPTIREKVEHLEIFVKVLSGWANPSPNKVIFRENILTCLSRNRPGGICNAKDGSVLLSDPVNHVSESASTIADLWN